MDSGKGLQELVSAARSAGLCYEHRSHIDDDFSLDPHTEWRKWGNSEERKRYAFIIEGLIPELCLLFIY